VSSGDVADPTDKPPVGYLARYAAVGPRRLSALLGLKGIGRPVMQTAASNIAITVAGALGGIIIARSTGATVRGEYSAVTSWLGIVIILGEIGQPRALLLRRAGFAASS
jgi:hypothetical protein